MPMKSRILISEKVENKERKFGENLQYYPCNIIFDNDQKIKALFTRNQIEVAINRGTNNLEDFPKRSKLKEFWSKIFGD